MSFTFYHVETNTGNIHGVDFTIFILTIIAVIVSIILGLIFAIKIKRKNLIKGFAIGSLFYFLFDLLKESPGIGTATLKTTEDLTSLIIFAIIFSLFFISIKNMNEGLFIAYLWSLIGVGMHSLGEGIIISYDFYTRETFLTFNQAFSYLSHKFIEGLIIGVLIYGISIKMRDYFMLILLSNIPFIIGIFSIPLGIHIYLNPGFFFSSAAAASIFIITRISNTLQFKSGIVSILIGFIIVYLLGALHSL